MKSIKGTKLLRNLSTLNSRELTRFRHFVQSPFFNRHQPTLQLSEYLVEHKDRWEKISKEELFTVLFPGQDYLEFKVNNVMSYLMELYVQYLEQLGSTKRSANVVDGLKIALQSGNTELFQSNLNKAQKRLGKKMVKDEGYYWQKYELSLIEHDYLHNLEKKYSTAILEESLEALDVWYLKKKLDRSCELISISRMTGKINQQPFLETLVTHIEQNWTYFECIPLINVYYKILKMIWHPDQEHYYFELANYFEKQEPSINTIDRKNVYQYLLNFCIKKTNINNPFYEKEALKLYKKLVENKLILDEGEIRQVAYTNIVSLACNLKEFSWAKDFVLSFSKYLPEDARENAFTFNMASILFYEKNYSASIDLIQEVVFTNIFYHLKTKYLQIRIYYEWGEEALLLSALDSLRIFVVRHKKLAPEVRKGSLNFVKFIKSLTDTMVLRNVVKASQFQEKINHLQSDIESFEGPIPHKQWLLEKIQANQSTNGY